jgi:hypothetical protein
MMVLAPVMGPNLSRARPGEDETAASITSTCVNPFNAAFFSTRAEQAGFGSNA